MNAQDSGNNVVFGFLGTQLDAVSKRRGKFDKRWERWRPTLSILQHPKTFPVSRLVLLYNANERDLLDTIVEDCRILSSTVELELKELNFDSPWDINTVFPILYKFIAAYPFNVEEESYFFHLTTGSHIQQASVFLSVGARYFPGKLLQSAPDRSANSSPSPNSSPNPKNSAGSNNKANSRLEVIDLDNAPRAIADIFRKAKRNNTDYLKHGIQTRNNAFNKLITQIEQVAIRSKAPMLIMGQTGAGKSWLASRIYELKRRRLDLKGSFVEINCATLRGDNAMSTLFGHKKGAFTGAVDKRDGLLRRADRGLLFLDEIGELGLDEQAMLLRAIEEKRFFPLGADKEEESDFQLIAGTNRDLRIEVKEGRFREDLFARINLWTYRLPGLAERREDIEPNIDYELKHFEAGQGIRVRFSRSAKARYLQFALSEDASWTGNFRDLNASITRMATLAESGEIDDNLVNGEIQTLRYLWGDDLLQPESGKSAFSRPPKALSSAQFSPAVAILTNYLPQSQIELLDLMEQIELSTTIMACLESHSAAEAGRKLYNKSRLKRKKTNDGARVITMLEKHGLSFDQLHDSEHQDAQTF